MNDDLKMCADHLLRDGALEEADYKSVTIVHQGGRTIKEFTGGLTQEHYNVLAPILSYEHEKAELAFSVIENILQRISWHERLELRKALFTGNEDFWEWLVQQISLEGFDHVANRIEEWWMEYRQTNPPRRFEVIMLVHPTWDSKSGVLTFGNKTWKFRTLSGPLKDSLDEFEECKWPRSVKLLHLDPDQVRDVGKELRERTRGDLSWSASSDCTLSWRWDR